MPAPIVPTAKLSYSYAEASAATGYSIDVIKKAVAAGDLVTTKPTISGRPLSKPVILAEELGDWLRRAA